MPKTAHTEAAEHHEKAAKSHRTAAEHHEKGEHATASKHADEAHGHSTRAHATDVPLPTLPAHIEETIRSIARLHAEHHQNAMPLQRAVDRITALLGRPRFVGMLIVVAASWISLNLLAAAFGYRPIDPPPFSGLESAVSLLSLYMVVLIMATQRREYQLAQLREQLTLELAILSEQKTAKVIQLLEESRRDNPLIHDRVDQEAEAMAHPADPKSLLHAIKETHAEAEQISGSAGGPGPAVRVRARRAAPWNAPAS